MVCDPIQQELKKTRIKILRWDNSPVRAIVPSQNQTPLLGLNIDFRDNVTGQALVQIETCRGFMSREKTITKSVWIATWT